MFYRTSTFFIMLTFCSLSVTNNKLNKIWTLWCWLMGDIVGYVIYIKLKKLVQSLITNGWEPCMADKQWWCHCWSQVEYNPKVSGNLSVVRYDSRPMKIFIHKDSKLEPYPLRCFQVATDVVGKGVIESYLSCIISLKDAPSYQIWLHVQRIGLTVAAESRPNKQHTYTPNFTSYFYIHITK